MKEEQFKKNIQRIKQKVRILLSNDQFQNDILKLRYKYNIDPNGLKSNEESEKWHKWIAKESESFAKNNLFPIQSEFKTPMEYIIKKKEFEDSIPINAFNLDLENLISKYRLSPKLKDSLRHYLLFNNEEHIPFYSNVFMNLKLNKSGKPKEISISIDHDTTLEDIKAIWKDVKSWQKDLPYRTQDIFQPRPNLEKDLLILNLRKKGETFKEIAEYLSKEYSMEVSHDDVHKRYQRLVEKMDIS